MGEKDVDVNKEANEKKIVDADNTKKVDEGPITVVLKLDLHCAGCAKKVKKSIQYIEGVQTVKADSVNNKVTITGKDDGDVKKDVEKPPEAKSNNQKPKEPQSTTVVLKIPLHCDGCSQKIKRIISKIDGVESVKPDANKNLVTVKGTMGMKELIPYLKDKLKRNVDIVPPKKEDDKGGENTSAMKVGGDDNKKEEIEDKNGDGKKGNDTGNVADNSGGDEKKKNDEAKVVTDDSDKKKPGDGAKAATNESEKKKSNDEAKSTSGGEDTGKKVDMMNKYEYYRHNPHIYTMPVYNQSYYNQDYGVPVFSTQGYGNQGYANYGYAMDNPHRSPPPPSPMSLHDSRSSETDLFNVEDPNACLVM
ncbi:hypothetical protein L1987_81526 [Smallanthus sonchifolius]|uniref:Uncharacterized protein n=1 Tax=Smallanthus sonchifolius TaxID=185202 RepID=A0ACB8YQX3_9ASTR|nr:hypothetical protein L1987_81526 [Smallanthus sonchifolius]